MGPRSVLVISAASAALLLFPLGSFGRPAAENTWSGTWNTNFGVLTLTQTGASVGGSYTHDQGRISGTVSGSTLSGTWSEAPSYVGPNDAGPFTWTLAEDGKSWSGTWQYAGGRGGGDWSGTCTAGACLETGRTQTVRFTFTQGGRPKGAPDTLLEVRTVGTGSITFLNEKPDDTRKHTFDIEQGGARVVRELDFVARDPDSGIAFDDRRLTLRLRQPLGQFGIFQPKEEDPRLEILLLLEVASSTDRACARTKAGKPRPASIKLIDGEGKAPDVVSLTVTGCPHHTAWFAGTKRVKVAIVHKK